MLIYRRILGKSRFSLKSWGSLLIEEHKTHGLNTFLFWFQKETSDNEFITIVELVLDILELEAILHIIYEDRILEGHSSTHLLYTIRLRHPPAKNYVALYRCQKRNRGTRIFSVVGYLKLLKYGIQSRFIQRHLVDHDRCPRHQKNYFKLGELRHKSCQLRVSTPYQLHRLHRHHGRRQLLQSSAKICVQKLIHRKGKRPQRAVRSKLWTMSVQD